jgi:antitoxin (DNA-binding transcriptional repressor) of toxin-antitoxin stability system
VRTATAADIGADLATYLDHLAEGPVVITRDGRPVAALIAIGDEHDLERLRQPPKRRLRDILEEAHARIERDGGLSEEEFWRAVDERYGDRNDAPRSENTSRRRTR